MKYQIPTSPSSWPRWSHCHTVFFGEGRSVSTWIADIAGCEASLEFESVEVLHDVHALANPSAIKTNLQLLDKRGAPLSEAARLVVLNVMVRSLNWQDFCLKAHAFN